MKTGYGDLPIVIDPATGRARLVQVGTAANSGSRARTTESRAPHAPAGRAGAGSSLPSTHKPAMGGLDKLDGFDSKLELERARYLEVLRLAGDVRCVVHHPFVVELAPKRTYTPDFAVQYADGHIEIEEVKGSVKQKNARDSITRFYVAARLLPLFTWQLVMKPRGSREWVLKDSHT